MPGSWPVAEYALGFGALVILGYVAIALTRRRNGKMSESPDLTQVVENNTKAMHDLTGMVGGLRELVLQTTTKQGAQLDEVVSFVRSQRKGD